MKTLRELYSEHDGKVSDKWDIYLDEYERVFAPYRDEALNLLEIGVQNGGSLEVWSKYFSNANVLIGCDINTDCSKLAYESEKIQIVVGNANTNETEKQIRSICSQFDIVIDDGSHTSEDIVHSFVRYFALLKHDGVFVVEDLHCSYWKSFGGGLYDLQSSLSFFKSLVDVINYEHWGLNRSAAEVVASFNEAYGATLSIELLSEIHSIEFINSLCVIRKCNAGSNRLGRRNFFGQEALVVPTPDAVSSYSQAILQDESDENSIHPSVRIRLRDEAIAGLQHDINELQRTVGVKESEISEQKAEADQLRRSIKALENGFDQCRIHATHLEYDIACIRASTSWRLTSPLRFITRAVRYVRFVGVAALKKPFSHPLISELRKATPRKVIAVYKREGLRGLKARAKSRMTVAATIAAESPRVIKPTPLGRHHYYQPLSSIDLSAYDVVSFDVFDTALVRLVHEPTDVFDQIGVQLGDPDFKDKRIKAEALARAQHPTQRDITLQDIYANIPGVDLSIEVANEKLLCRANPEAYLLYTLALAAKKKIYFVSDVYLPESVLTELLTHNGYQTYDALLVSSEDDLIKGDGSRFDNLIQGEFKGQKVLHVGDNRVADFEQPLRYNIAAVHYAPSSDFFRLDPILGSQMSVLTEKKSKGMSLILGFYRSWLLGFRHNEPSFWEKVGFLYGGALIYQFVKFSHQQALAGGSDSKLYFLARDGQILQRAYQHVWGESALPNHYLWASRRCMSFPLLKNLPDGVSDNFLYLYFMVEGGMGSHDVIERFGYDLPGFKRSLTEKEQKHGHLTDALVKEAILENEKEIRTIATQEYNELQAYLDSLGYFEGTSFLVDVGWGGTIQDCLATLYAAPQAAGGHAGIYIGVRSDVVCPDNKVGYLFNQEEAKFAPFLDFIEFLELLTSSTEDGVIRVSQSAKDEYRAVRWPASSDEERRKSVAAEIQTGIMAFVRLASAAEKDGLDMSVIQPEDFLTLYQSLRRCPSSIVVEEFNSLAHSRMISGPHIHSVLKF